VKLPAFPFHSWLPDAHTEAPTAGSVILAGVLLKTGAYGLLRFTVPLFPAAAHAFAPVAMWLGAIGIIYGAVLAFAQSDMKRLVAYSSVSHMGFVIFGVFAWNTLALQGVMVQIVAHGVSTGALFIVVGFIQERLHTRDMRRMGGLAADLPRLAGITLTFAIASLGLPGLGNFVGEFLVLIGGFGVDRPVAIVAALGLVTAVVYALTLVQRALHGGPSDRRALFDTTARETVALGGLIAAIVWLGFYPQPLLDAAAGGIGDIQHPRSSLANAAPGPAPARAASLPAAMGSGPGRQTPDSPHGASLGAATALREPAPRGGRAL
jgi:NADH-quinone oxidoreductase subunit M